MVKVYKFGGASIKDADGFKNVANIIMNSNDSLVVVVSALGKTTNALESIVDLFVSGNIIDAKNELQQLYSNHLIIAQQLFNNDSNCISQLDQLFGKLEQLIASHPSLKYDFDYDRIVSFGELFSSWMLSCYLTNVRKVNRWVDIRDLLKTDDNYRQPSLLWDLSDQLVRENIVFNKKVNCYVVQGFIASTTTNQSTTLGREGSDYTAAILANLLNASSVTIWKDVPGVLTADPRWYPYAIYLPKISYWEAIELTYHGAQVIHPKTLKPLQNKGIPLYVKSFLDSNLPGTTICQVEMAEKLPPIFILKTNQIFITLSPRDFSFIVEDNLSDIFTVFSQHSLTINLMQKSALNFSVCIDNNRQLPYLLSALKTRYVVRYNDDVELVTIRHYTQSSIDLMIDGKEVIDSQVTRKSARYVVVKTPWVF